MKKVLFLSVLVILFVTMYFFKESLKILPYYEQLSKPRVSLNANLQPKEQKDAHFVGSKSCQKCHKDEYKSWHGSMHPKMIQDIKKDPSAVVADFSTLPKDADFTLKDAVYTVGGKFKQRYMIEKDFNGTKDFILGNYQWNTQTKKWQHFKPWKYWYKKYYHHDNKKLPTSKACDGCHFTGFMSRQKRVELGISCESCHGPASKHIKDPDSPLYVASNHDSIRMGEICFQCHLRNRDKRLETDPELNLTNIAVDYPLGYEAGRSLTKYKMSAPFTIGKETKEFWANGAAKKNRTQGNELIHSVMGKHGITCINCHDPHSLNPTAQKNNANALCMKCHSFGSLIGPHQKSLQAHTHHKANSKGSLCVECHMPKTAKHTGKSPLTVRSHLFGFTTPAQTKKFNMPPQTNACFACHKDKSLDKLQKDLEKWGMNGWDKR